MTMQDTPQASALLARLEAAEDALANERHELADLCAEVESRARDTESWDQAERLYVWLRALESVRDGGVAELLRQVREELG
jgi:hypothetical protein